MKPMKGALPLFTGSVTGAPPTRQRGRLSAIVRSSRRIPETFKPMKSLGILAASCAALLGLACWSGGAQTVLPINPLDDWHWRMPLPQGNNLTCLAYGNGAYAAAGEGNQVVISSNGRDWAAHEILPF